MINYTLEILLDSIFLAEHQKLTKSIQDLQIDVSDWALDVYNQLAINEKY